jgi:hypothetical protein
MFGKAVIAGVAVFAGLSAASAETIDWATWSNTYTAGYPTGGQATATTSNGVDIKYTGEVLSVQANYPNGYPNFYYGTGATGEPSSSYVGGIVGNAPPVSGGIVQIQGGASPPPTDTITFTNGPVTNPVLAIWSLGQSNDTAMFDFVQTPVIQQAGPSSEYGGTGIYACGTNEICGAEGNGTIEFVGTFGSISWTNPSQEYWYGFTVGVAPLPSTWTMLIAGFVGLGFLSYFGSRKRSAPLAV